MKKTDEHLRVADSLARYTRWLVYLKTLPATWLPFIWEKSYKLNKSQYGRVAVSKRYGGFKDLW